MKKIKWHFHYAIIYKDTLKWFSGVRIDIRLSNGEIISGYPEHETSSVIDVGLPKQYKSILGKRNVSVHIPYLGNVSKSELIMFKLKRDIPF